MGKLPIRPIIVVEAYPKEIEKNQTLHLSARLFSKRHLTLIEVSRIFMTITSLTDGHTIWPLEVIRKNASGFDIGIGTQEMKQGHDYLVRVSNNWNLSPSASTTFTVKESTFPLLLLVPIIFSPLFIKKYQDKGIKDVDGLVQYLKTQGFSDERIKEEVERIVKEVQLEDEVRIPIDLERQVAAQKWVTQMDHRVCELCRGRTIQGKNQDGVWTWIDGKDPHAPDLPEHFNCRCTYDFFYVNNRDEEFRAAASLAGLYDLELPLMAIKVINEIG